MFSQSQKRELFLFLLPAYALTFLMGLVMWYGTARNLDISAFPNAQMLYPAAGVIVAYLITRKEDKRIPRAFYILFLLVTILMVLISVLSVLLPDEFVVVSGIPISVWMLLVQVILIVGSLACLILCLAAGREKRTAYGLSWKNTKASLACIALFTILYFLRSAFSLALSGQIGIFMDILKTPTTWISLVFLSVQFFLVFIAFFGEEYGWRYYLQPLLQEKFGLRGGVMVLGIVWGLWHLPVDFFYYSQGAGVVMAAAQQITCITLGIFFAYAYMKTQNIWVPVILHFLNNNLIPIISGNYSADVLQSQNVSWEQLPMAFVINALFFGIFLFAKPFQREKCFHRVTGEQR